MQTINFPTDFPTDFKPLEAYKKPIPFVRKLCKDKSERELITIEENFRGFILLIYQIASRIYDEKNNILKNIDS